MSKRVSNKKGIGSKNKGVNRSIRKYRRRQMMAHTLNDMTPFQAFTEVLGNFGRAIRALVPKSCSRRKT